jgi:hypothetical protein
MIGVAISIGMVRVAATASLWAMPVVIAEFAVSLLPLSLAFTMWMLLCGALLPRSWALIGCVPFFVGEVLVRELVNIPGAGVHCAPMWPTSGVDAPLLLVLVLAHAAIFVCYHMNRRSGWAALAAMVVLLGVDEARALLWR